MTAAAVWVSLTRQGRRALQVAYDTAQTRVRLGEHPGMPVLPVGAHRSAVASLERRGLVADGRLTARGVSLVEQVAGPLAVRPEQGAESGEAP